MYVGVPRENYETFQADGPWESGAPGWSIAPVPGWGMNPNQTLPRRQATAGCGCSGMGDDDAVPAPAAETPAWGELALIAGVAAIGAFAAFRLAT